MPDILHRIGIISSSTDEVYEALTSREALAGWWTTDTRGSGSQVGEVVEFPFADVVFVMKVISLTPPRSVTWEVTDGLEEWIGTAIGWDLKREGDYVIVLFRHLGWKEPVEMMHHCSTKWATYLMSLKSLIEKGKGAPHPDDVKIDNWN